jgi:Fic family protein
MSKYIHQLPDWPIFGWDQVAIFQRLIEIRHKQGRLLGKMEGLGFQLRAEASLGVLTLDVTKTSEIEGEILSVDQVRSSIARKLGMNMSGLVPSGQNVEGIVDVMIDATREYETPLTTNRLFNWHSALFPTGRSGMYPITVGAWRTDSNGPMQVISGAMGKERIHYEAPEANKLSSEMESFLNWFNTENKLDAVLKSAIAHLWFVSIHPFDDGNGRMARAIADMQMARADKTNQRFYSMSAQIQRERAEYYDILERTQQGTLDITKWLQWFLNTLDHALNESERVLSTVLIKARFWEKHNHLLLNERQRLMLNKLLDGFDGKLTSSKWAKITKSSADTALRDITYLLEIKALKKDEGGGRSTSYSIVEE